MESTNSNVVYVYINTHVCKFLCRCVCMCVCVWCMYVCGVCVHMLRMSAHSTACLWSSEEILWELVLSFHHMSSKNWTQVFSSALVTSFCPLNYLTGPNFELFLFPLPVILNLLYYLLMTLRGNSEPRLPTNRTIMAGNHTLCNESHRVQLTCALVALITGVIFSLEWVDRDLTQQ